MPQDTPKTAPPAAPAPEAAERLDFARQIALEAGAVTLQHFRSKSLSVDRKSDDSPVTIADRDAEELLRKRISERFPDDAILGEEFGEKPGVSGLRWVLDPIDGTKSFIHGAPLYTTLIAVLDEREAESAAGEPLLGVINAPATGETVWAAVGGGCWSEDRGVGGRDAEAPTRCRVSSTEALAEGLLLTTAARTFRRREPDAFDVYTSLQDKSRLTRTWGDAYGYLMVATGRAEVMIDAEMSLWDAAALKPIIEEAGGRFCDWSGEATVHSGEAIATNGLVADEVLAHTRGR
ncbi:Histidinol-phosphatase [Pseudobythopirellula maris]|uniref:Histidinol-phosphatase n=1 Tax=Pseudobythopirellula maris TaxID=2527991 RepID=A0A5C5ZSD5_9BACT|nr:histidinol-phosphatase [Pseudobythopirellula maris]TWT89681.1 Histidinol-phosphatase [Pseudobythopirellula maris]